MTTENNIQVATENSVESVMSKDDVVEELQSYGIHIENKEREMLKRLKDAGTNPQSGLTDTIKTIEELNGDENAYWAQYRGDYLDLRDFLKPESMDDKKTFLKNLTKGRVILIREHILQAWTFNPEQRERLEDQLEIINLVIYSGAEELDALEKDINDKKDKCGYYKD